MPTMSIAESNRAFVVLLDEPAAAAALGMTRRALQQWRHAGTGPKYVRISSRCVRYRPQDLEAFARERLCGGANAVDSAA